jgi:trimeric autotransporter adhesin
VQGLLAQFALHVARSFVQENTAKRYKMACDLYDKHKEQAKNGFSGVAGSGSSFLNAGAGAAMAKPIEKLSASDLAALQQEAYDKLIKHGCIKTVAERGLQLLAQQRAAEQRAASAAVAAAGDSPGAAAARVAAAAATAAANAVANTYRAVRHMSTGADAEVLKEALQAVPAPPAAKEPAFMDAHKRPQLKLTLIEDVFYAVRCLAVADATVAELQAQSQSFGSGAPAPPREPGALRWPDLNILSGQVHQLWNADYDHALLRGVAKYGWLKGRDSAATLLLDPELGFPSPYMPLEAPADAEQQQQAAAVADDEREMPDRAALIKRLKALTAALKRAEVSKAAQELHASLRARPSAAASAALVAGGTGESGSGSSSSSSSGSNYGSSNASSALKRLKEVMLSFGVPIALLKTTDTALQLKHDRASALKQQQQQAGATSSTSSSSASSSAAAAAGGDAAAVAVAAAAEAAEAELWKGLSLTWADLAALARWPDRSSFIQECQQQLAAGECCCVVLASIYFSHSSCCLYSKHKMVAICTILYERMERSWNVRGTFRTLFMILQRSTPLIQIHMLSIATCKLLQHYRKRTVCTASTLLLLELAYHR